MKKIWLVILLTMWTQWIFSDNLYQHVNPRMSLFSDKQPKRIGDIITVLISEKASARGEAGTSTGKDSAISGGPGTGIIDFISGWGLTTKEKSEGKGQTTRGTSFSARISARVVDILPGGNLKIEGTQVIIINNEKQNISISGIVRQDDISAANTVHSYQIADAQITYTGKGPVSRKQKEGILSKILGAIF